MMERDKFMSADEAKELGLIDEVLTSPPKMVDSKPPSPEWQEQCYHLPFHFQPYQE